MAARREELAALLEARACCQWRVMQLSRHRRNESANSRRRWAPPPPRSTALRTSMSWRVTASAPRRPMAGGFGGEETRMTPGRIAAVITCHDLGRTLVEALESVERQTRPAAEIVVVDDALHRHLHAAGTGPAGADGTRVVQAGGRGVSAARNCGARLTSAEYLVWLDADDVLEPGYFDAAGARLDADPDLRFRFVRDARIRSRELRVESLASDIRRRRVDRRRSARVDDGAPAAMGEDRRIRRKPADRSSCSISGPPRWNTASGASFSTSRCSTIACAPDPATGVRSSRRRTSLAFDTSTPSTAPRSSVTVWSCFRPRRRSS